MPGFYNPLGSNDTALPGSNQYGSSGYGSTPGNTAMPARAISQSTPSYYNDPSTAQPYQNNPYQVPGSQPMNYPWGSQDPTQAGGSTYKPRNLGHGIITTPLQYPGLSQDFVNYLMTQVGAGVSPFGLQTPLPTGGMTQPGQLTAGLNPLLSQLQNFFMGGSSSVPGMGTLSTIANQGISALPEWQSMINAQQQNIAQQQANLKEQFGYMGDIAGSPTTNALANFQAQTTADQNALLGQLQQQNILQGQLPAIQSLFSGAQQMGGGLQALDQQAIQNMYQEFQRVSPQNNPMLQYLGAMSTLYPPTTKTPTGFEQFTSLLGALGGSGFSTGGSGGTSIQF